MTTDTDLEHDVRAMLARRAADVDPGALRRGLPDPDRIVVPLHRPGPRRPALLAVAAALVLVALVGAVVATRPDGGSEVATDPTPSTAPALVAPAVAGLPPGVNLATVPPLWRGGDDPGATVDEYLRDRMDKPMGGGWGFSLQVEVDGDWSTVRWESDTDALDQPTLPTGAVHLRQDPGGWSVVAALTQGVIVSGVVREGDAVRGPVTRSATDILRAEVRTLDGSPVGAPVEGRGELAVEVAVPDEPVALRVAVVGGSLLGISEVAYVPPAAPVEGARPPAFEGLPEGVDPLAGDPLFVAPPVEDPAQAHDAFLYDAFGELRMVPAPTQLFDRDDVWTSFAGSTGEVDAEAWPLPDDDGARSSGISTVRRDAQGRWGVVALTSDVLDLTALHRDGHRLAGRITATIPAPLRLVVGTPDGAELASIDLTTTRGTTEASVLDLDLGERVEVGFDALVVRVEVGSAPGQVGIDGVEVAGLAAVGLPAVAGTHTGSGTTTTLPGGEEALAAIPWPSFPGYQDPAGAAEVFVEKDLADEEVVDAEVQGEGDRRDVRLTLDTGVVIDVVVVPVGGDAWGVATVGGGGITMEPVGAGALPSWDLGDVPDGAATLKVKLDLPDVGFTTAVDGAPADAVPGSGAYALGMDQVAGTASVLVVFRDAEGRTVGMLARAV